MAKFLVAVVPSALPKTDLSSIRVKQILNPPTTYCGLPSQDRAPRNDSWTRGGCFSGVPSRPRLALLADCAVIFPGYLPGCQLRGERQVLSVKCRALRVVHCALTLYPLYFAP
jgi:hypothetical protein